MLLGWWWLVASGEWASCKTASSRHHLLTGKPMYHVLLLQCSTHSLRAAFCSLWLSMSKTCFCAPKHSLRNRSPSVSAWSWLQRTTTSWTVGCWWKPRTVPMVLSRLALLCPTTVISSGSSSFPQVKMHMPEFALQLGPMPEGYILHLGQPGMSWQCQPSVKPFGYGGQSARHISRLPPACPRDGVFGSFDVQAGFWRVNSLSGTLNSSPRALTWNRGQLYCNTAKTGANHMLLHKNNSVIKILNQELKGAFEEYTAAGPES